MPVDLPAHDRDGLLIDLRGVPRLDRRKVRLARLVAGTCAPTMGFQEICGRAERIGGDLEISGALGEDILGHELGLADLAMHRAAGAGGENAAIDELQRRVELFREELRTTAVVGERRDRGEHVLIAALAAEAGLHAPDRNQRPGGTP